MTIDKASILRVFVDASNLKPGQGGIRTYTVGVLEALTRQPGLEITVATSVPADVVDLPVDVVELPARIRDFNRRIAWREWNLARELERHASDVLFSPVPELPFRRLSIPSLIVVHDVGPLVAPALYGRARWLRYAAGLGRFCSIASAVVCVSRTTLLDLHRVLGVDPQKCRVIGEGVTAVNGTVPRDPFAVGADPYVLYVGSSYPHKNLPTLLTAFALHGLEGVRLVLAGPQDEVEAAAFAECATRLGLGDRVVHEGFVSPERLAELYAGAAAVAIPSLHEGVGLPVIEAMKVGLPVVASDIAALREIAGDAAAFVGNPLAADEWRDALRDVIFNESSRSRLARRGRMRAELHSWSLVGDRLAAVLAEIAA